MVSKLRILLILAPLIHGDSSFAFETIELGDHRKNLEFKRYIQSSPNLISLNEKYLDQETKKTEKILTSKYDLAVKGLLLEDLKPSIFVFKEITSWPTKSFLSEVSSSKIFQSHMRLAHLDKNNASFWIEHALFFNPNYKPKAGLFNPGLMEKISRQRELQNPYTYSVKKDQFSDQSTWVYINGNMIDDSALFHPSGEYSFTFLKDGFKKKTFKMSGDDIPKLKKVKLNPLDLGTCKSPIFKKTYGIQIEKIYFSKDCIRSIQDQHNKASTKPGSFTEKKSSNLNKNLPKKPNLFSKKTTWYVIGAAVATGILVSALYNQNNQLKVTPVEY